MKTIIALIISLVISSNTGFGQNWISIHQFVYHHIDKTKIININNKRTLFFQTWGVTGAPYIGCNDTTWFRTYKMNSSSNHTYKPYGTFLDPFVCPGNVITETCGLYRPGEFDVSNFDSNFVIKYYLAAYSNFCPPPDIKRIVTSTGYSTPGDEYEAPIIRISPFNDTIVYSIVNDSLYKSTNRGQNWFNVTGTPGNLRDVILNPYDSDYIYLISSQGQSTMFISTNGGVNFNLTASNFISNSSLYFKNEDTVYTWNASDLFKSDNKGLNWILVGTGAGNFNCLEFHPALKNVYYAGFGDLGLYVSTNSGLNFRLYNNSFPNNNHVYGILKARPDKDSIFVVTRNGVFLTYDQYVTKIVQTSYSIPERFSLSQNYPNPFNPRTIINYELKIALASRSGNLVLIKVFDALGKEVTTLVNEKQNAGSYSVEFSGEGLPSGVYFYKLETTDFVDTKRMVLLK